MRAALRERVSTVEGPLQRVLEPFCLFEVAINPESRVKVDAVRDRGAEVVLHGETYSDAHDHASRLMNERGLTFVHPFDDPDVIAGQGTIAMEILRQHTGPIDAVFVAIGGGGLISGIATYLKQLKPQIKVIGVQTEDSDAMARSVEAGELVELDDVGLFSDGTAVRKRSSESTPMPSAPRSRTSSPTPGRSSNPRARSRPPGSSSTSTAPASPTRP